MTLLDSHFRGNNVLRSVGGSCEPIHAFGTGRQKQNMARDSRDRP